MTRPAREILLNAVSESGSIRKAAPSLGVHERTLRRWLMEDEVFLPDTELGELGVLLIDIETRPNLAYVWDLWNQNINLDALVERTEIICWAAKWLGEPGVEFRSGHHDGHEVMVNRAWELLNTAGAVVHYNGAKFDIPHLNREFVLANLGPPAPYKQIDLLKTAKKRFRFPSNKLANVSLELGIGGKVKHEGYRLWFKCMAGDEDAWTRMRAYNVQDVQLLEDLYARFRPWIVGHPSYAALRSEAVCPRCGSDKLERRGTETLTTATYQRFCCKDCGSWSRSTKREAGTTMTDVAQ